MNELNKTTLLSSDTSSPANNKKLALLRERARSLAAANTETAQIEGAIELVEFKLAHETYGIEAKFVKEIYLFNRLRKIPGTPDYMLGVINLHGKIVSLIDLKRIIGLDPSTESSAKQNSLILTYRDMELAILIDSVIGIRPQTIAEISKGFTSDKNAQDNYISAVSSSNTIILDAMRILNDPKLTVNIS